MWEGVLKNEVSTAKEEGKQTSGGAKMNKTSGFGEREREREKWNRREEVE